MCFSGTIRLDRKHPPYDLIWEDDKKLSGKVIYNERNLSCNTCYFTSLDYGFVVTLPSTMQSFYLPGAIDLEDQQLEQWNLKPPLLSLWSRSDWTVKHQEITVRNNLKPVDCNFPATEDGCAASQGGRRNVWKKNQVL